MTGQDVTECTGSTSCNITAETSQADIILSDPRLNVDQALELAFMIADTYEKKQDRV